jgi:hypothetical protein
MIENIVMISSLIKTTSDPLTYTNTRSVYTHEERFEQTMKTIASVRKYIPKSQILLIDCSEFTENEEMLLKKECDCLLNAYHIENICNIMRNGPSKSFAEATQTHIVIEYLINNNILFKNFFKISGRYQLNEKFNYDLYDNDKNVGRIQPDMPTYFLTSFYKLNKDTVIKLNNTILNNISALKKGIPYEEFFHIFMNSSNDVEYLKVPIGIDEYISVNGEHRCH